MTHRKHTKRPKGELVATTASPKEKQAKCQKAYNNRKNYKKEYVNVPINITIGNSVTTEALRELRKMVGLRYYITLFSIKKELNAFEAAEYIKKGFKVEIIEELKYSLTIVFINYKHRIAMKEKTVNILSYVLLVVVFFGIGASIVHHLSKTNNIKENTQQQPQYQENEYLFYPELVDSIEIIDNDTQYFANVYYDTIVLYTSVEEAESLITQMDTAYSKYSDDDLELEESLGAITDNSLITKIGDSYILELDWIKK